MSRRWVVSAAGIAWVLACARPEALILCHNGNCANAAEKNDDDTLSALRASLQLTHRGRSPFDGVEVDLRWDGAECLFAHDPHPTPRVSALAALAVLSEHLAAGPPPFNERFHLAIDLKVGGAVDHDALIDCAYEVARGAEAAAAPRGIEVSVLVGSADAGLLGRLVERGDWNATPSAQLSYRVCAGFGESPFVMQRLADFPRETSVVSVHADNAHTSLDRALRHSGSSLLLWQRLATRDLFGAIERFSPEYVTTNEPLRLRQWLGD